MHPAEVIALGYRYPDPAAAERLAAAVEQLEPGDVRRHLGDFVREVSALSLGAWEELHTETLDLSAPVAPYVGHITWGDSYRRGEFMAALQAAMLDAGVTPEGELPDHIEPILRYLAVAEQPFADLLEVLSGAVVEMEHTLRRAGPDNPYCHLLAATVACAGNKPVRIGARR